MGPEEKQCQHVGIGGYKCPCCGPKPKQRKQHRRVVRRRLKALFRKRQHYANELLIDTNINTPL